MCVSFIKDNWLYSVHTCMCIVYSKSIYNICVSVCVVVITGISEFANFR